MTAVEASRGFGTIGREDRFRTIPSKRWPVSYLRESSASKQAKLMLARYYGQGTMMRFLSVDPSRRSARGTQPQSWNRYTYAVNSPLNAIDPDGQQALIFINNETTGTTRSGFNQANVAVRVQQKFDKAGADATVTVGKASLLTRAVAWIKGDSVVEVHVVNGPGPNEGPKTAAAMGHSTGLDAQTGAQLNTEVHMNQALQDNPATKQNERNIDVSNSVAHEAGHELGLVGDNSNIPEDVMTSAQPPRSLEFNAADAKQLKQATK